MAPRPPLKNLGKEWSTPLDTSFNIQEVKGGHFETFPKINFPLLKVLKQIDKYHKKERKYTFTDEAKEYLKKVFFLFQNFQLKLQAKPQ